MYETDDGYVGLPSDNVWRMIFDAAKSFKLGETVKRALHPNPDVSPILIDGKKCKADTYVSKGENRMFYHSVKIGKSRVMRARPRIPAGWVVEAKFVLLTDELEVHTLTPVLERAGRLIGVGDWRPKFGLCTVEVL
jgi:hypothetical protein